MFIAFVSLAVAAIFAATKIAKKWRKNENPKKLPK
jgi:uncharacterized membrane protein